MKGYEAILDTSRSPYGVELDIAVPESQHPIIVAQDVYGEVTERLQVLVYPAGDGPEVEEAVGMHSLIPETRPVLETEARGSCRIHMPLADVARVVARVLKGSRPGREGAVTDGISVGISANPMVARMLTAVKTGA